MSLAVLAAVLLLGAAGARAQAIGFVYSGQPSTGGTITQTGFYAYNSSSGAITIQRKAKGSYKVTFAGLGTSKPSDVQVTAYGADSRYCVIGNWDVSGADAVMNVLCYTAAGASADSAFTLLFQARGLTDKQKPTLAFLWADQASTTTSYTPPSSYQYNSTGGSNTVTRTSTGFYTVFLPGIDKSGSTVLVTAYGFAPAHCMVQSWGPTASGTNVFVACTDTTGAAADELFTLVYSTGHTAGFSPASPLGGAVWASSPTRTAPYVPEKAYSIQLGTAPMTVHKMKLGHYAWTMTVADTWDEETALVTAYGNPANYCKTFGFTDSAVTPGQSQVGVQCYTMAGKPANAMFVATYQTAVPAAQ